jgi:hypothetical protein
MMFPRSIAHASSMDQYFVLPWIKHENFDMVAAQVVLVKQKLVYHIFKCEDTARFLAYLDHLTNTAGVVNGPKDPIQRHILGNAHTMIDHMKESIQFLKIVADNNASRGRFLSERADIVLQAVCFKSLITVLSQALTFKSAIA